MAFFDDEASLRAGLPHALHDVALKCGLIKLIQLYAKGIRFKAD